MEKVWHLFLNPYYSNGTLTNCCPFILAAWPSAIELSAQQHLGLAVGQGIAGKTNCLVAMYYNIVGVDVLADKP